jgi:hypothetical protein
MQLPRRGLGMGLPLAMGALLALAGCEEVSVNVVEPASVEISPNDVMVFEGEEEEVSAIVRSSGGEILTGRSIQWTIDDAEVAVVSSAGVVRGEEPGTTTIRARAGSVEGTAPVTVLVRRTIGLSRSEVEFHGVSGEGNPPDEEVDVVNEGGGTLSGLSLTVETEGNGAGWLSASLGSSMAPTTLTISASVGSRPAGVYQGTVRVSSPEAHNSPQEVQVTLEVEEPPPIIDVDPPSVSFSSVARSHEPATQDVVVTNGGGGTLSGLSVAIQYADGPTGWLSAELTSSTAPTVLGLVASARELTTGTYRAEVELSSPLVPGGSATIDVVLQVTPGRSSSPDMTGKR